MGMSIEEMLDCFKRLKYAIEEGENVDSTTYEVYPVTISFKKEDCMEIKEVVDSAIETMHKYQQLQADYEARLRDDMVAMLTVIQLEIEEMPMYYDPSDISDLIQQKINALKEER